MAKFNNINISGIIGNQITIINGSNNTVINGNFNNDCIRGKGKKIKESLPISGIRKLRISDAFQVFVNIIDKPLGIGVYTFENIMPLINIHKSGETLDISYKECVINPETIILINTDKLDKVEATGAVYVKMEIANKPVTGLEIDLDGTSTCEIAGNINIEYLEADLSGASELKTIDRGYIQRAEIDVSGSSSVNLLKTLTEKADIDLSGASSAYINAKYISADVSGVSSLHFKRERAVLLDIDTSGMASVIEV